MSPHLPNSFPDPVLVSVPPLFAIDLRLKKSIIQQLLQPGYRMDAIIEPYHVNRVKGLTLTSVETLRSYTLDHKYCSSTGWVYQYTAR